MLVNVNVESNSCVLILLLKDFWRIIRTSQIFKLERMLTINVNATSRKIKYSEENVKIAKIKTLILIFQNIFH